MRYSIFAALLKVVIMPFGYQPWPGELDPPEGN